MIFCCFWSVAVNAVDKLLFFLCWWTVTTSEDWAWRGGRIEEKRRRRAQCDAEKKWTKWASVTVSIGLHRRRRRCHCTSPPTIGISSSTAVGTCPVPRMRSDVHRRKLASWVRDWTGARPGYCVWGGYRTPVIASAGARAYRVFHKKRTPRFILTITSVNVDQFLLFFHYYNKKFMTHKN